MSNKKTREYIQKGILLFLLLLLVGVEFGFRFLGEQLHLTENVYMILTRLIGGLACVLFVFEFSFQKVMSPLGNKRLVMLAAVVPAFVIAVNNFPFVAYFSGDCSISANVGDVLIYALLCLCVGFFEELAFRGCALMFFLKSRTKTRLGVFLAILYSSVIFGVVHLFNIFTSSPGAVFLQMGYSALIGALCSVVLLATGNIWLCVLCHALYNFCGGLKDQFGSGIMWTSAQMSVTAIIAVVVTVYIVWLFFKIPMSNIQELFVKPKED